MVSKSMVPHLQYHQINAQFVSNFILIIDNNLCLVIQYWIIYLVSTGGVLTSGKFTCGSTPTSYEYDNGDCSGTPINTETDSEDIVVCDAEDCPVTVITIYDSCDKSGDYQSVPLALGCFSTDSFTADFECATGQLTINLYSSNDCSGNKAGTFIFYDGCDDEDNTYTEITCGAMDKFIGIAVIIALFSSLFE